MSDAPAIVCIAVSYRSNNEAKRFAQTFSDSLDGSRDLLVLVDNTEDSIAAQWGRLNLDLPSVEVLSGSGNVGYFGGARVGVQHLRSQAHIADWYVISNVDISVDWRALRQLLSTIGHSGAGVVVPRITSSISGAELNPYMISRPSELKMRAYCAAYRWYSSYFLYDLLSRARRAAVNRMYGSNKPPVVPSVRNQIYAGHGSFLVLNKWLVENGNVFDHEPFLFGEEISVAEAARKARLPVLYCPEVHVRHDEHVSVRKIPSRNLQKLHYAAAAYCVQRYFSSSGTATS